MFRLPCMNPHMSVFYAVVYDAKQLNNTSISRNFQGIFSMLLYLRRKKGEFDIATSYNPINFKEFLSKIP